MSLLGGWWYLEPNFSWCQECYRTISSHQLSSILLWPCSGTAGHGQSWPLRRQSDVSVLLQSPWSLSTRTLLRPQCCCCPWPTCQTWKERRVKQKSDQSGCDEVGLFLFLFVGESHLKRRECSPLQEPMLLTKLFHLCWVQASRCFILEIRLSHEGWRRKSKMVNACGQNRLRVGTTCKAFPS